MNKYKVTIDTKSNQSVIKTTDVNVVALLVTNNVYIKMKDHGVVDVITDECFNGAVFDSRDDNGENVTVELI